MNPLVTAAVDYLRSLPERELPQIYRTTVKYILSSKNLLKQGKPGEWQPFASSYAGGFTSRRLIDFAFTEPHAAKVLGIIPQFARQASETLASNTSGNFFYQLGASFATRTASDYVIGKTTLTVVHKFDQSKFYNNLTPREQNYVNALVSGTTSGLVASQIGPLNDAFKPNLSGYMAAQVAKNGKPNPYPGAPIRNAAANYAIGLIGAKPYIQEHAGAIAGQELGAHVVGLLLSPAGGKKYYAQFGLANTAYNAAQGLYKLGRPQSKVQATETLDVNLNPDLDRLLYSQVR